MAGDGRRWGIVWRCALAGAFALVAGHGWTPLPAAPEAAHPATPSASAPAAAAAQTATAFRASASASGDGPALRADGCRPDDFTADEMHAMEASAEVDAGLAPQAAAAAASEAGRQGDALLASLGRHLAAAADERTRAAGWFLMGPDGAEALVAAALVTRDPVVYRWALQACGRRFPFADPQPAAAPGACALLSNAQAAELDPDNAVAHLRLLAAAQQRGDPQAVDALLDRAARSQRVDAGFGALAAVVAAHPVPGASGMDQFAAMTLAFGVEAASSDSSMSSTVKACSPEAVAAPERRSACGALGELMVAHGRSLLDVHIGARLAERAGVPDERLAVLKQRQLALDAASAAQRLDEGWAAPDAAGCAGPARMREHALATGDVGEVGVLDAWIASSGRNEAGWAQVQRQGDAALAAAAAASRTDAR